MARAQRSLKTQSTIFKAIQKKGQIKIAEFMGVSETVLSQWLNNQLPRNPDGTTNITRNCDLLTACGLKVVPEEWSCISKADMDMYLELAQDGLKYRRVMGDTEEPDTEHMLFPNGAADMAHG